MQQIGHLFNGFMAAFFIWKKGDRFVFALERWRD